MAFYSDLRSDRRFTEGESETTGVKVFFEADTANACTQTKIPEVGDAYDTEHPGLKIVVLEKFAYGYNHDTGKDKYKWACQYSTAPNLDLENQYATRFSGGAQIESIKLSNKSNWGWAKHGSSTVTDAINNQSIYKVTTKGSYSRLVTVPDKTNSEHYPGVSNFETYMGAASTTKGIIPSLGKVNLQEFVDVFAFGQCLFQSFDDEFTRDKDGIDIHRITLNFTYVFLNIMDESTPGNIIPNIANSQQYIFNDLAKENEQKYQKPVKVNPIPSKKINGVYLYDYIDFNVSLDITP